MYYSQKHPKMKKTIAILISHYLLLSVAFAQTPDQNPDEASIKAVIQSAYVDGIQNLGEIEAIEKGFHPDFEMLMLRDNALSKLGIANWIEMVKRRKADPRNANLPVITCKFLDVDVTGNAAVAKLDLYRGETLLFTDYLCLYRFEEGWRIVTKLFHRY
jgi:hypothetical protein